jgi:type IV pilus assembly protein PilP
MKAMKKWLKIRKVIKLPLTSGKNWILAGAMLVLLTACTDPDMQDLEAYVAATKQASSGEEFPPLPEVEPYQPFTYTAEGLKDPFAFSTFVIDAMNRVEALPTAEGDDPPDLDRPREELEKYALGALEMVGTFRDFNGEDLWALIRAPDGIVHKIRTGNYLGENFGRVYNITEDRLEVQEKVLDTAGGVWNDRESFLTLAE